MFHKLKYSVIRRKARPAVIAAVLLFGLGNCASAQAGVSENPWRKWDEADAGVEKAAEFSESEQQKIAQWKQQIAAETGQLGQAEADQTETQSEESQSQASAAGTAASEAENETKTEAQTESQTVSEYIFPDVDSRYLTEDEVHALTLQAACYAKNEIYARHGRQFLSAELQEYFGEKSWYSGTVAPADFQDSVFNEYERANLMLIVEWETTLQSGGYQLDQPGYDIHLVNTGTAQ